MAPIRRNRKEGTAQVVDADPSGHADRLVQGTTDNRGGQICTVSLSHESGISSSEHVNPCFSGKLDKEHDTPVLSTVAGLSTSERNLPIHPFKVMNQMQYAVRTTGPVGESEAMRKWKEIKQNGFLSHPHGGMPTQPPESVKKKRGKRSGNLLCPPGGMSLPPSIPPRHGKEYSSTSHSSGAMQIPPLQEGKGSSFLSNQNEAVLIPPPPPGKQHDGKQSKRKEVDPKKDTEIAKRDQADKFKNAPPSGLLSGLNIGIIRRMRNQKEFCAIMEATVQPEKPDVLIQNNIQVYNGSEENKGAEDQNQFAKSLNRGFILPGFEQRDTIIVSENALERVYSRIASDSRRLSVYDKKSPSGVTPFSDFGSVACGADISAEQVPSLLSSSEQRVKSPESSDVEEKIYYERVTSSDHNNKLQLAPLDIATKACGTDFSMEQEKMFTITKKGLS